MIATLAKPEDYVPAIFGKMYGQQKKLGGTIVVRIGVTGTGSIPNYRLDHTGIPTPSMTAYDGHTHKEFSRDLNIDTGNWSTRSLTLTEVADLLALVRQRERGKHGPRT